MRVLIFHGYLLRGTGSNVYNAELAKALARLGHEVHLFCQDIHARELSWVDAVGDWDGGALHVESLREPVRITAYRPNIGRTLPVYVADRYERFDARPFNELSEDEVNSYIDANVRAVREVAQLVQPDAALANHAIMGPCILARALSGERFAAKVHGSALEYQVKPYPRFMPFAIEGLAAAQTVLVGSRHTAESLWEALPSSGLDKKTRLGPPGVDVDLFAPRDRGASVEGVNRLAELLEAAPRTGFSSAAARLLDDLSGSLADEPDPGSRLAQIRATYDPSGIDQHAPAAAAALDPSRDRIVSFVGKLIVSKGVDLLLLAWPLVRAVVPEAKLAIAGFGAYREGLELLQRALSRGDIDEAALLLDRGRELEGGPRSPLNHGLAFLQSLTGDDRDRYIAAARSIDSSVVWFGRLEHDLLVHLVTASELQAVTSTFPEAYGMVAAEAAAAGAYPVVAAHSGLAEVARDLKPALSAEAGAGLTFPLGDNSVHELADRIITHLQRPDHERAEISQALRKVAVDNFSWEQVAAEIILASDARHDHLRLP